MEAVFLTVPDLEVVCVTGLPARTENVRAVFFARQTGPFSLSHLALPSTGFRFFLDPVYNGFERFSP